MNSGFSVRLITTISTPWLKQIGNESIAKTHQAILVSDSDAVPLAGDGLANQLSKERAFVIQGGAKLGSCVVVGDAFGGAKLPECLRLVLQVGFLSPARHARVQDRLAWMFRRLGTAQGLTQNQFAVAPMATLRVHFWDKFQTLPIGRVLTLTPKRRAACPIE
jgi:hypothetical protein